MQLSFYLLPITIRIKSKMTSCFLVLIWQSAWGSNEQKKRPENDFIGFLSVKLKLHPFTITMAWIGNEDSFLKIVFE